MSWSPPQFSPSSIPTLPTLSLSEGEKRLIESLQVKHMSDLRDMQLSRAYREGAQIIDNLDIAVPDQIAARLRTLVGWARMAVDPYIERLGVDGFRVPGETDVNGVLAEIWDANGLDAEQGLAFDDALTLGRGYWMVGTGDDPEIPRITVESPLSVAASWDLTGRVARSVWQTYEEGGQKRAALMLPEKTIHLERVNDVWEIIDVDAHGFGHVPMVRMPHAPTSDNRAGRSAITPELQSIIDSACRTLLDLEVARELYSAPRWVLLNATESFFKNEDGSQKRAWDTYLTKVLGIEESENGETPSITQLQAYDPSVFTKLIEMYASEAAGHVAAVPQELGLHTTGNPTNAESLRAANGARDSRVRRIQRSMGTPLADVMKMALRFRNNGALPAGFERVATDWHDLSVQTPNVTADAMTKYIFAGSVPPRSDIVLKRAGFNAVERQQLEADWPNADAMARRTQGQSVLDALSAEVDDEGVPRGDVA